MLMLNPPNNVKELQHFLRMVQYYQDMWEKCSKMLAPLSNLVGECGEMKTTRKIRPRKVLGGGIQFTKKLSTTLKQQLLKR